MGERDSASHNLVVGRQDFTYTQLVATNEIDTAWFEKLIKESPYSSIRQLAKQMRKPDGGVIDHSAVSRMIRGERAIQLYEARQLADLLGVPMSMVIKKAGIPFGKRDNLPE